MKEQKEEKPKVIEKDITKYQGRHEGFKVIRVFWEEGMNEGEEVIIYESPYGLIETAIAIPEGKIPSEKACRMSEYFYRKGIEDKKAFQNFLKNKEKKQ